MKLRHVTRTSPSDIKPGDVFAVTVTFYVNYFGGISAYRCPYPDPEVSEEGIPQGDDIPDEFVETLAKALVPVLMWRPGHES